MTNNENKTALTEEQFIKIFTEFSGVDIKDLSFKSTKITSYEFIFNFSNYLISQQSQSALEEKNKSIEAQTEMIRHKSRQTYELYEENESLKQEIEALENANLANIDKIHSQREEIEALKKENEELEAELSEFGVLKSQNESQSLCIKQLEEGVEFLSTKNNYLIEGIRQIDWRLKQSYYNLAQIEVNSLLASAYIKKHNLSGQVDKEEGK